MSDTYPRLILTLNVGSASLKFAVYRFGTAEECQFAGTLDGIGRAKGRFRAVRTDGSVMESDDIELPTVLNAWDRLQRWLLTQIVGESFTAVGHRIVHGGRDFHGPTRVSPEVIQVLRSLVPFAPNHLPASLAVLDAARSTFPSIPHIAVFDTSFHQTMPTVARSYGLPRTLHEAGLQRYGFHGLSYQSILDKLTRIEAATGRQRVVIAHLGNGASLCAIVEGRSVDTTMGLTPMSGLIMGTRCGDVDPEVLLFLLSQQITSPEEIRDLLSQKSGLLGVSGLSGDVRDLLAAERSNPHAAEALQLFCYSARKGIASMTAAAGGLDTLVFTAGIGANSPVIRSRITSGLAYLGVHIDPGLNESNAAIISSVESKVTVRVMATNEELLIAQFTDGMILNVNVCELG